MAGSVTSYGPMAVGDHARAVQTIHRGPLIEGLTELRKAVEAAELPTDAKAKMVSELTALEAEAKADPANKPELAKRLRVVADMAKSVREIVGGLEGLTAPLRRVAGLVGLTLGSIGVQ
jgi:hypothetical protein